MMKDWSQSGLIMFDNQISFSPWHGSVGAATAVGALVFLTPMGVWGPLQT